MKVRALTFNVWFEPVHMEVRMEAIGRVVERARPAVIGFQELTRESLAMLRRQRWAKFYDCSVDVAPPCSEAYFVALFSALPVLEIHSLPFANSGMDRELVAMRVELAPGKSLVVGTSHLESMPENSRARVAQLQEAMHYLEELVESNNAACLGAVFMGDTNLMRSDLCAMDPNMGRVAGKLEVEHAKSGRSKCRMCDETIPKGEVRIGKIGMDRLPDGRYIQLTMWHHQKCFLGIASVDEKRVIQSFVQQVTEADAKKSPTVATHATAATAIAAATTESSEVDLATLGLPNGWKDLWLSVSGNTEENGYTFDGKENGHVTSRAFRSRLDRVYFHPGVSLHKAFAASSRAVLEDIQIVGKEPISTTLWPSDHFGVLASFNFDADEENSGKPTNSTTAVAARASSAASAAAAREQGHRLGSDMPDTTSLTGNHDAPTSRGCCLGRGSSGYVASAAAAIYDALTVRARRLGSGLPRNPAAATSTTVKHESMEHRLEDKSSARPETAAVTYETSVSGGHRLGSDPPAKKIKPGGSKETALMIK